MLLNVKNHTFSYNFFLSCWIMFYVKSYFVLICSLFINIYNFKCLKDYQLFERKCKENCVYSYTVWDFFFRLHFLIVTKKNETNEEKNLMNNSKKKNEINENWFYCT